MVVPENSAVIFRLRGVLDFTCQLDISNETQGRGAICRCFEELRSKVTSESLVLVVSSSSVLLWPNKGLQTTVEGLTQDTPCRDIQQYIEVEDGGSKKSSKKKDKKNSGPTMVNLKFLMEVTEAGGTSAPSLFVTTRQQHCVRMPLYVDCVLSANGHDTLQIVCSGLVGALCRQLGDMEEAVLRHRKGSSLLVPQVFHFQLPSSHLVTAVYPAGVAERELLPEREELHRKYGLPSNRPCFRRSNAFHFPDEPYRDGYLRNPHTHLTPPTLEDSNLYVVRGVYSYHHYMQDRVDDDGWGCAYRSLQTICSWFQQQGYTERAVPTHTQIQQALVDVGDKDSSFVGSRQWIGSIEVQAVLNQLLGVTSKILFVRALSWPPKAENWPITLRPQGHQL
ncbi:ufm1-specific protease 2 isoform X2 [Brachyhypopomus gauderio]|uniref:ufm1-specific protease 2 isoform X2 n=1 Tax=Brachyhypopomus gauderio TaxID=698409 RepID=UPI00404244D3